MAGFSGAVEDGARGIGTVVALVVAVVVGWRTGSVSMGVVVFVAGYAAALFWGRMAGDSFRERQFRNAGGGDDPAPGDPEA